jgi:hypothetical protein
MNHLLNSCHYTAKIWDQAELVMRTSDHRRESILETIANWWDQAFRSPILNHVWQLIPGFILWKKWKERNIRLFKGLSLPWHHRWHQCYCNILESLPPQLRADINLNNHPDELPILRFWSPPSSLQTRLPSSPVPPPSSLTFWSPPLRTSSSSILMGPLREIQD